MDGAPRGTRKPKGDLLDRLVNISTKKEEPKLPATEDHIVENTEENEEEEANLAETYRWEWINPELANENTGVRPSDIKKAILQEKTPEVVAKVIAMANERDPWAKTVDELHLEELKLIKQIALNSVLLEQNGDTIKLGLRSAQKHLLRDKSLDILQQALAAHYASPIQLEIEFFDDESRFTPLDYRRQVYHELSERAKADLQRDQKLQLLQKMFDAKLDMDSIRPV